MKKTVFIVMIIVLNMFQYNLHAQTREMDSLKLALKNAKHDTTRCRVLLVMIDWEGDDAIWPKYNEQLESIAQKNLNANNGDKKFYLRQLSSALNNMGYLENVRGHIDKALEKFKAALKLNELLDEKANIANNLNNIGMMYYNLGDSYNALNYIERSLKICEEIGDTKGLSNSLNNIGSMYENLGDMEKAFECYRKSLKIREETNDKFGIATTLNNIGLYYHKLFNRPLALEYYLKGLKVREEINDKSGVCNSLNNISTIYDDEGNFSKSLEYSLKALQISREVGDRIKEGTALSNIGYSYYRQGDFNKSLEYYKMSLKIREESGLKEYVATDLCFIAGSLLEKGQINEALISANRGLLFAKQTGYPENIKRAANILKKIYEKQAKFKEALEMHELFVQMRDSVYNESTRKSSIKKQFQIEYEREAIKDSIANIAKLNEEQIKHEAAITQQRSYTYGGFAGLALMLVVAGVSFRAFKNKQKANIIITEQKKFVDEQKHIIEEKQKEIIDSINYARRIQRAHFPSEKYIFRKMNELKKEN